MTRVPPRPLRPYLTLAAIAVGACGGAVEQSPDGSSAPPAPALSTSATDAPPVGTWQLVTLERTSGGSAEVHDVLQMELRDDRTAVVRRCGKPTYEPGLASLRCEDASSYDCYYGTLERAGEGFRVALPSLFSSGRADQGVLERDGNEIVVRYVLASYPSGRFVRLPEDGKEMMTTSSVNACSR